MFNKKEKESKDCLMGSAVYSGCPSYIHMVRWDNFMNALDFFINATIDIRDHSDEYDICKTI